MRRVNKWQIIALVILIALSSFSGCIFNMGTPGPYTGNETALFTMVTFSVPGCNQIGTKIEIIEADDQGRILFKIRTGNSPLYFSCFGEESPLFAFAICQYYDDEKVYYYEDDCWFIYAKENDFSITDQEQLKERNDWNLALNYGKMIEKTIIPKESQGRRDTGNEWQVENGIAKEAFLKLISIREDDYVFPTILDDDGEGRILLTVVVERFNDGGAIDASSVRAYLEMIDTKAQGEKAVIEEILDPAHIWTQIKEFKKQNHWHEQVIG